MLNKMDREERLRLMQFVCSFAWADLDIQEQELAFVAKIMQRLGLTEDERQKVEDWLIVPPTPEEVDPALSPPEHRQAFLDAVNGLVLADDNFTMEEREQLSLFKQLLG